MSVFSDHPAAAATATPHTRDRLFDYARDFGGCDAAVPEIIFLADALLKWAGDDEVRMRALSAVRHFNLHRAIHRDAAPMTSDQVIAAAAPIADWFSGRAARPEDCL